MRVPQLPPLPSQRASMMQGQCATLCPPSELNARPNVLEQWTESQIQQCGCEHAQRDERDAPRRVGAPQRPSQPTRAVAGESSRAAATSAAVASDWLTPVAAYRRTANTLAHLGVAENAAREATLLRTPATLERSITHLLRCVWRRVEPASRNGTTFATKYAYLNDRLRQIKKEVTMQSLSSTQPLLCIRLLERMVRFYASSQWILFGSAAAAGNNRATPEFDASMNQDRLNDCMQALLDCYSDACRVLSNGSAASPADGGADAGETPLTSIAELLEHSDRFRSYAVLMRLQHPWMELQQQLAEQEELSRAAARDAHSAASSAGTTAAPVASASAKSSVSGGLLPPHLHLAARLCSAFHTCDYARFFTLYKRLSDPSRTKCEEDAYDPIAAFLIQQSVGHSQLSVLSASLTPLEQLCTEFTVILPCAVCVVPLSAAAGTSSLFSSLPCVVSVLSTSLVAGFLSLLCVTFCHSLPYLMRQYCAKISAGWGPGDRKGGRAEAYRSRRAQRRSQRRMPGPALRTARNTGPCRSAREPRYRSSSRPTHWCSRPSMRVNCEGDCNGSEWSMNHSRRTAMQRRQACLD